MASYLKNTEKETRTARLKHARTFILLGLHHENKRSLQMTEEKVHGMF